MSFGNGKIKLFEFPAKESGNRLETSLKFGRLPALRISAPHHFRKCRKEIMT